MLQANISKNIRDTFDCYIIFIFFIDILLFYFINYFFRKYGNLSKT